MFHVSQKTNCLKTKLRLKKETKHSPTMEVMERVGVGINMTESTKLIDLNHNYQVGSFWLRNNQMV